MKHKYFLVLAAVFMIGAALYIALLWHPFGGWIFDHIVIPLNIGPQNRNPDFLEGIGVILVALAVLLAVFLLPYILLWVVIAALLLHRKKKTEF